MEQTEQPSSRTFPVLLAVVLFFVPFIIFGFIWLLILAILSSVLHHFFDNASGLELFLSVSIGALVSLYPAYSSYAAIKNFFLRTRSSGSFEFTQSFFIDTIKGVFTWLLISVIFVLIGATIQSYLIVNGGGYGKIFLNGAQVQDMGVAWGLVFAVLFIFDFFVLLGCILFGFVLAFLRIILQANVKNK